MSTLIGNGSALCLLCAALLSPAAAQFPTSESGAFLDTFWPELDVFFKLNADSRIYFFYTGARTREEGYTDGQLGIHYDLYTRPIFKGRIERNPDIPRNRFLMLRVGYVYAGTPPGNKDPFVEHMPTVELTTRFSAGRRIIISDRNRGDFRFVNELYTPRYRNRLKAERSFGVGSWTLTPYAHAEAFYDWRYDVFHRFRFAGGAEWEINNHIVLEGYYMHQIDTRSSDRHLKILGVALQVYLP